MKFAYVAAHCMLVKGLLTNMLCGSGKIEILSSCTKLVCCLARSLRQKLWYGMVWYGMVWYGMVWYGICNNVNIFDIIENVIKCMILNITSLIEFL